MVQQNLVLNVFKCFGSFNHIIYFSFRKKIIHFFGVLGTLMFSLGFLLFTFIVGSKLFFMINDLSAKNIADMSAFYIAQHQ